MAGEIYPVSVPWKRKNIGVSKSRSQQKSHRFPAATSRGVNSGDESPHSIAPQRGADYADSDVERSSRAVFFVDDEDKTLDAAEEYTAREHRATEEETLEWGVLATDCAVYADHGLRLACRSAGADDSCI